jgi:hypothetical protein
VRRSRSPGIAVNTWLTAGWWLVRSAPLTYLWLAVLLITTVIQHHLSRHELHTLLVHRSTNIAHLSTDPLYVLFASLFWIDGGKWVPCLVLFSLFVAPAERWLGQIRWLAVGLTAHVVATYISEGLLYLAIERHLEPERMVHVRDVGVSYFMVGVMAVFTYHVAPPWRWIYLAGVIVYYGAGFVANPDFTGIGHCSAIAIGLCCYPLARRRDVPLLNPARWFESRGAIRGSP